MGRAPCCDKANVKKGPWAPEEDAKLKSYIEQHGTGGNWIALPQKIGLKRCGKSCRLRWLNYLRPNIKHGGFSEEEDRIICSLYVSIGSRWSIIAAQLPGRTDNDIKNYWNTRLKKKLFGKQRKEHHHHQATRRGNALKQMQQMKIRSSENTTTHGVENSNNHSAILFSLNEPHGHNNIRYWPQQQLPVAAPPFSSNNLPTSHDHISSIGGAQFMDQESHVYNSDNHHNNANGYGQFLPIMEGESSSHMVELVDNNDYNMAGYEDPRRVLCGLEFLYGDNDHYQIMAAGCNEMGSLQISSCPSNYEAMLQDLSTTTQEYDAKFDELRILDNKAL